MFPRLQWERVRLAVRVLWGVVAVILPATGEDVKGDRFLGGEHPRFISEYADSLREIIPIHDLPPRIKFQPQWRSLIPDPSDSKGIYMVVYLVNDTDQPVPRAVGELQRAGSQMNIAGNWFARDPMVSLCGTVPAPRDLPARHALALGVRRAGLGDTDGVIRYAFPTANVFSEPMPGRYESAQADWALSNQTSSVALQEAFWIGIEKDRWEEGEIARDSEDFAALLEIVRHYQLCVSQKRKIRQWIAEQSMQPVLKDDLKPALDRMEETLGKAWVNHNNSRSVVNRCVAALEAPPPGEFGTPDRCVGVVWRYLCHGEMAGAVGGADAYSRAKLLKLAEAALAGSNRSARKGAALFLARRSKDGEFPATRFLEFLESGVPEICKAGLEGLTRRGKASEAGPWMLRLPPDDPALCNYYQILRAGLHGKMRDWEAEVIKRLLDHQAVEALFMFSAYPRGDSTNLPSLCEASLRRALVQEIEPARRTLWQSLAERSADRTAKLPERDSPQGLTYGIRQLDQFEAAGDAGLFSAFLDHPASSFNFYTDGSSTRFFTAREAARAALRNLHIPLVTDVVTEIKFAPPEKIGGPANPEKAIGWRASAGLYGLLATVCLIVGFRLWKKRASKSS